MTETALDQSIDTPELTKRDSVPDRLEPTLFGFIYKHSLLPQIGLLIFTVLSFPIIYISLELPKSIMDDAIRGSMGEQISLLGQSFDRLEYLWLLCFGLMVALLTNGVMKMKLNTWKGIVGERLLRRLRYRLLTHVMRFAPGGDHKQKQGELVAMITSEVEPLGGIMGDALAQPVFQAGQMLTILGFLFVQNVWLGLAAVATIPIQAIVIPILQRRINVLHRQRVLTVRELADHIGDTTQALSDLRSNGGVAWTLAGFSARLGHLFDIRFDIFRKKFFMKFLNNMIGNLTPLTFYAIGGFLVIQGDLSVGALVVALAAYKDIADPWRELLAYINQVQESMLRYKTLTERFNRKDLLPADLVVNEPEEQDVNDKTIEFDGVVVEGVGEDHLLCDLNLEIKPGEAVAFSVRDTAERRALTDLFVRERLASSGVVRIAGQDITNLHQARLTERIGLATSEPALIKGTIVENIQMSIRRVPDDGLGEHSTSRDDQYEALASGNFPIFQSKGWVRYGHAGVSSEEEFIVWWSKLIEAMEMTQALSRRALDFHVQPDTALANRLLEKRYDLAREIREKGLDQHIEHFDRNQFHTGLAVGENILFGIMPQENRETGLELTEEQRNIISGTGLEKDLEAVALDLLLTMVKVFGKTGADHPLFTRLTGISGEDFDKLSHVMEQIELRGQDRLHDRDREILMALPFRATAEQFGSAFPEYLRDRILDARKETLAKSGECDNCNYASIDEMFWNGELSVIENLLFGKLSKKDAWAVAEIQDVVLAFIEKEGLLDRLAALNYEMPVALGGGNLAKETQERISIVRAAIRRPSVLVLETALSSHDYDVRRRILNNLRQLLAGTTFIVIEQTIRHPESYDQVYTISHGRIVDEESAPSVFDAIDTPTAADLENKRRLLSRVDSFSNLSADQTRLLAYASDWVEFDAGEPFFRQGGDPDYAYILQSGKAEIRWPADDQIDESVSEIEPGRLIGDMSIFLNNPRTLDLIAIEDCRALRIGARELNEIIRNDISIALHLLETVSGHLDDLSNRFRGLSNSIRSQ